MAAYFDKPKRIDPKALENEGYAIVPIRIGQKPYQVLDTIFRDTWCSCGKPHALVYGVHMLAEIDSTDTEHCEKTKECVRLALNKIQETEERAAALLKKRSKACEAENVTAEPTAAHPWENIPVRPSGKSRAVASRGYGGPTLNQRVGKTPSRRVV